MTNWECSFCLKLIFMTEVSHQSSDNLHVGRYKTNLAQKFLDFLVIHILILISGLTQSHISSLKVFSIVCFRRKT